MVTLAADANVLTRYQILKKADLKVSTVIATLNARGDRMTHLAWFWSMDIQHNTDSDDWMEECKWPISDIHLVGAQCLLCPPEVYQVHWLRAMALHDRTMEEAMLIHHKMAWT